LASCDAADFTGLPQAAARSNSMSAFDFRINSQVRSLLARHWLDLNKVQIGTFHGTVRLTGKLTRLGGELASRHEPRLIEILDIELRGLNGVERVYFDVVNWKKNNSGEWVCTDAGEDLRLATTPLNDIKTFETMSRGAAKARMSNEPKLGPAR
jgi:hypothetical protein